jgi:hypothetical protein
MFVSRDGRWRIQVISRNGQQLYRISHKGVRMNGHIPLHAGSHRIGPVELGHGWWLAEDTPDFQRITHWVPLDELEEASSQ